MEIEAKKAKSRPICKYAFLQKKQLGLRAFKIYELNAFIDKVKSI